MFNLNPNQDPSPDPAPVCEFHIVKLPIPFTLNLLPFPWNHIYCIHPSHPGVYIIPKKFTPGRIHVGASGRWLVWDPDTPRPRHVARVLLASLACSLRSRPQPASRPSALRTPGVPKITTGMLHECQKCLKLTPKQIFPTPTAFLPRLPSPKICIERVESWYLLCIDYLMGSVFLYIAAMLVNIT